MAVGSLLDEWKILHGDKTLDQPDLREWQRRYAATPEREAPFTTLSPEPIRPL